MFIGVVGAGGFPYFVSGMQDYFFAEVEELVFGQVAFRTICICTDDLEVFYGIITATSYGEDMVIFIFLWIIPG